jgi:hypothetical protein
LGKEVLPWHPEHSLKSGSNQNFNIQSADMNAPSSPNFLASKSFTDFPRLPVEIRYSIWSFAAPRRPRILQVFYAPEQQVWQACKNGCGGLPSIVHVSREARAEALKGYTKTLDAHIHLKEDTIFISDPVFTIREPRATFMDLECVKMFERIALSSDLYQGLESTFYQYPKLSESPARILRKFEGLKHFTLAVSDDGETFRDGSPEISIEELLDFDVDDEDHHHDLGEEEIRETFSGPEDEPNTSLDYDLLMRRRLDRLDKEALAIMSKGYFRHVGNVHFESTMNSVDHWDSWDEFRGEVSGAFAWEKRRFREWKRPSTSIMIVKYGLLDLYHFAEMVLLRKSMSETKSVSGYDLLLTLVLKQDTAIPFPVLAIYYAEISKIWVSLH